LTYVIDIIYLISQFGQFVDLLEITHVLESCSSSAYST